MKQNVTLTAHRGYRELYPENTMIAFKKALELDAPFFRAADVAPLDEFFPAEMRPNYQKFVCKNEVVELQLHLIGELP